MVVATYGLGELQYHPLTKRLFWGLSSGSNIHVEVAGETVQGVGLWRPGAGYDYDYIMTVLYGNISVDLRCCEKLLCAILDFWLLYQYPKVVTLT